jgi:hypothetical protein
VLWLCLGVPQVFQLAVKEHRVHRTPFLLHFLWHASFMPCTCT